MAEQSGYPAEAAWHRKRARRIEAEFPEARAMIGPSAWSAIPILGAVALQFGLAEIASQLPTWGTFWLAAVVGSFVAHALGVAIHECSHDLVFRQPWANKTLALIVSLPLGVPGAMTFRAEHLLHHAYLGARDGRDHQAPYDSELGATGHLFWTKVEWLFFARAKPPRPHAPKMPKSLERWHYANAITTFALWPIFIWFNPSAFLYLFVSTFFAFRVSVVCMRRYSEHVGLAAGQPTSSYYGWLNWVSFFVGYHVEHHDFPNIAWYRLPRLRRIASRHYEALATVRSWSALAYEFLFKAEHGIGRYTRYYVPEIGPSAVRLLERGTFEEQS